MAIFGSPGFVEAAPDVTDLVEHRPSQDEFATSPALSAKQVAWFIQNYLPQGTDPADPRPLAYYFPHGPEDAPYEGPLWWKKPNFNPEGYFPNVYQARWKDDIPWVSERGSGLYVLDYTGPVPGPLAAPAPDPV